MPKSTKHSKLIQDRDDCARHLVNIWRDAYAFSYDQPQMLAIMRTRVWDSPKYKRLPQYMKEYVRGFERSYQVNVIDRQYLEHGNYVTMPDGSVQWFGLNAANIPLTQGKKKPKCRITSELTHANTLKRSSSASIRKPRSNDSEH